MGTPGSEEELAAIVAKGGSVHVFGSGTKSHHGPWGSRGEDVCLRRLDRITHYEPGDLVVCVQTGMRLADLQEELGKNGQWLSLDPPYPDATIGGILATNSSGPRRLGYGTVRDLLIGCRVLGPDGTFTKSGGRVVKNVTGYDLHKLHIGAFGTLGIVTEANFKIRPKSEVSAAIILKCESFEQAHALSLKIFDSPLRPVALEAMDGRLRHIVEGRALVIVGVEGSRPVLDRHFRELKKLSASLAVLENERAAPVWNGLRTLPEALKSCVRVRFGAKPHVLPKILPGAPTWARVGSGVATVDLEPGPDVAKKVKDWNGKAGLFGGYAVVESAPPDMKDRHQLPWGPTGNTLMKAVRRDRDPKQVFNPGRMVM